MDHETRAPLRVAVFSDTHLPNSSEARDFLLCLLDRVLPPVDLIIHAGDLVAPELLDVFDSYPVHAVRGNMDPVSPAVPLKKIITLGGFTFGLVHGWGHPRGLEERALAEFSSVSLDCLIYGHSHVPVCHHRDGILFFNPGSATDKRHAASHTVGLLEIDNEIRGQIIALD